MILPNTIIIHRAEYSFTTLELGIFYKKCIALLTVEKVMVYTRRSRPPPPYNQATTTQKSRLNYAKSVNSLIKKDSRVERMISSELM